jgi:hypothetical protein
MSSVAMMSVLFGILALVLLGFFATFWLKDRNRSQEESHDTARLDTDNPGTRHHDRPGGV